jgi:putative acetyltransferase
MIIRESTESDLSELLEVERQAFGIDEGPVITELVYGLLSDPTAKPLLSLIAVNDDRVIGHILFTKARLTSDKSIAVSIMAPLAVVPDSQRQGVGGKLIAEGLKLLSESDVKLVFVLGHPDYYPRHGFKTAGSLGFEAPYPIPENVAGAWMVQELSPGFIGSVSGRVLCADVLDQPEHWSE